MDADSTLALLSRRVLRDELLSLLDVGEQLRNRLLDQLRFELNSFADAEVLLDAVALKAKKAGDYTRQVSLLRSCLTPSNRGVAK